MQKAVDFLERYCQWIAVGVGALFFLFALSQYLPVVTTPVTAEIDSRTVTPGEIDSEIVQAVADPLETAMNDPSPIAITVPKYVERVTELATKTPKVPPLSPSMAAVRKVELPTIPWDKVGQIEQGGAIVIRRPELPAAVLDPAPTSGFAQVTPATAQPGATIPAPATDAAGNLDVTWVRVPFTVPMAQVDREFRDANVPGALARTNFVRVELIRQRQLPDDSWGPEETVKPIDTVAIQAVPAGGNPIQLLQFNEWAIQNQQQIVQPPFYSLVAGDNPMTEQPSAEDEAAAQAAAFDPETYTGSLDKLTPEQKKLVQEARQRKAKEAAEARRAAGAANRGGNEGGGQPRGGQRGGAGAPRGGPGMSNPSHSETPTRTVIPFQARVAGPPGGGPPGGPGMPPEGPGYPGGYPGEGGMAPGAPGQILLPPIANQQFIPVAGIPDVMGHAFDMSAKPGAVYRYRIRYSLMNPLFNANAAGVAPAEAAIFEIFGEDKSKWSEPITVKSNNHIYLQAVPSAGANLVRMTLFRWQNGKWNRSHQTFSPGDSIGKLEGDVDYRSNYTLVEVRRDSTSERAYALLMADDGSIEKRDFDLDSATKQFKDLNIAVDGPPVPANPTGREGGPGGGYPGGGYPGAAGGGYPGGGRP